MSLTTEIRILSSPIRRWFDCRLNPGAVRDCLDFVNRGMSRIRPMVIQGTDFALSGMAFDYAFRWQLAPLEAMAASQGALALAQEQGWSDAPAWVEKLRQDGDYDPEPTMRARRSIALSWFETYFHSGELPPPLAKSTGMPATDAYVDTLLNQAPVPTIRDVVMLLAKVPETWGDALSKPHALNPTFDGSLLVNGADADWIIDGVLYDCKVSARRRPCTPEHLMQILGYALLDFGDRYRLRRIGWYYPRQEEVVTFPLPLLMERVFVSGNLAELRQELQTVLEAAIAAPA